MRRTEKRPTPATSPAGHPKWRSQEPALKPGPAIIWIRGGGWVGSDKSENQVPVFLSKRGMLVASINYRLSNEAIFPAAIEDGKCAIRFVRPKKAYDQMGLHGELGPVAGATHLLRRRDGSPAAMSIPQIYDRIHDFFKPALQTHPRQQLLESRVLTQRVENRLDAHIYDVRITIVRGLLQPVQRAVDLAQAEFH